MSLEAMTWAFKQILKPAEKILLLAIADYADDGGACWPSVGTLVEKTNLSERTIRTHLRMLEHLDLLTVVERRRENGSQTSNRYVLHMAPAKSAGGGGELLPGQEPSYEPDLTKTSTSQSSPIAASDRTDAGLSMTEVQVARRAGLSVANVYDTRMLISNYTHREVYASSALTVALWILDKAKSKPIAAARYVATAIRESRLEVQQYIDEAALT